MASGSSRRGLGAYSARPLGGLSEPSPARGASGRRFLCHCTDLTSAWVFSRGSRDFVALPATCLRLPRRSTQLQSAVERSSIGWTVGTFARPRGERAKVPLPLHRSDDRSGFFSWSRDFV